MKVLLNQNGIEIHPKTIDNKRTQYVIINKYDTK